MGELSLFILTSSRIDSSRIEIMHEIAKKCCAIRSGIYDKTAEIVQRLRNGPIG
jgi:hypothetical protein